MSSQPIMTTATALGPVTATGILVLAGPVSLWALITFLLLVTRALDIGELASGALLAGLMMLSMLCALACRRAVIVLRAQSGAETLWSRAGRLVMLLGILAMAQAPIMVWSAKRAAGGALPGGTQLTILAGISAALVGAMVSLLYREKPAEMETPPAAPPAV